MGKVNGAIAFSYTPVFIGLNFFATGSIKKYFAGRVWIYPPRFFCYTIFSRPVVHEAASRYRSWKIEKVIF
jgi:hypothetical protein